MKAKRWNQIGWVVLSVCIFFKLFYYAMSFLVFHGKMADSTQFNGVIDSLLLPAVFLPYRMRIIAVPLLIVLSGLFFSVNDAIFRRTIVWYDIELLIVEVAIASLIAYCWKKGNAQRSSDGIYVINE